MHKTGVEKAMPGIIQVLKLFDNNYSTYIYTKEKSKKYPLTDFTTYKTQFINSLSAQLSKLFDIDIPFEQTKHKKHCDYCSYKNICRLNDPHYCKEIEAQASLEGLIQTKKAQKKASKKKTSKKKTSIC